MRRGGGATAVIFGTGTATEWLLAIWAGGEVDGGLRVIAKGELLRLRVVDNNGGAVASTRMVSLVSLQVAGKWEDGTRLSDGFHVAGMAPAT